MPRLFQEQNTRQRYLRIATATSFVMVQWDHIGATVFDLAETTATLYIDFTVPGTGSNVLPPVIEITDPESVAVLRDYFANTWSADVIGEAATL